jgi:hypothetical protein
MTINKPHPPGDTRQLAAINYEPTDKDERLTPTIDNQKSKYERHITRQYNKFQRSLFDSCAKEGDARNRFTFPECHALIHVKE